MKRALALIVAAFGAVAWAQPAVYRCAVAPGHVEYRDTPCAVGTSVDMADPAGTPFNPFDDSAEEPIGDWHDGAPVDQQLSTRREEVAIAARVQEQQRPIDERKRAQYAENRSRCATALRIADACGKFAGTFYCDERGFQPIAPANARVVLDNAGRYRMERCAIDNAKRHPRAPPTW